jgi:putative two-component system response regulator
MDELEAMDTEIVISSARLHDIGKIAISDMILNKPGKLTQEEFELMKTHALEGERIIDQIISRTENVEFLFNARLFAGTHHEKWDGSGYPNGFKGLEIPLLGRMMAVADVYDALITERPYKKAFSPDVAMEIIEKDSGTHFDPRIVEIFLSAKEQFKAVSL